MKIYLIDKKKKLFIYLFQLKIINNYNLILMSLSSSSNSDINDDEK